MPSRFLLPVALAGALLSPAAHADDCPPLDATTTTACVANDQGWFYATSDAEAASMADAARQAAIVFERHFQRPASRGAVVSIGSGTAVSNAQKQRLETRGAAWVLPWIGPDDKRRLAEAQVRRQIESQLGAGADAGVIDAAVARTLEKLPGRDDGTAASALRHEIGHMLLIHAFPVAGQRDADRGNAHGYGSGLPDWLDETAAVLMEDAAMAERRREALKQMLACGNAGRLPPLARFFTMDHPLAGIAREQLPKADAGASGSRVVMVSGEQAEELAARGIDFYVQSRALADFLMETSGDAAVFGSIARTLAAGGDMDGWLAQEGIHHRLPGDVAGLQDAWQAWLDRIAATAGACKAKESSS